MDERLLSNVQQQNEISNPSNSKNRKFIPYIHKMYWFFYRKPANFIFLLPSFLTGFFTISQDLILSYVIDIVASNLPIKQLIKAVIIGFIIGVVSGFLTFINFTFWVILGSKISLKARSMIFKSLMEKDIEFFDTHSIGDLLSLLTSDAYCIERAFVTIKSHTLRAAGQLVSSLMVAFYIDPKLAMITVFSGVFIFFFQRVCRQIARKNTKLQKEIEGRALTIVEELFSNFRIVSYFNAFENQLERYVQEITCDMYCDISSKFLYTLCFSMTDFLNMATSAFILNLGKYFIISKDLTYGQLYTLTKISMVIGTQIAHLIQTAHMQQKGMDASDRIFEIIDQAPTINNNEGIELDNFKGKIEFRNVYFHYPTMKRNNTDILKDISFIIDVGEIVAFVGHSGSGKSTIVQLLLRFYDVTDGEILLDDVNINLIKPRFLHRVFGVVQQDTILMYGTIKYNISYSCNNREVTDDEIKAASEAANISKFIEKLPYKYDTMVGEKGESLSGGQRQRVAIARAILKNPRVLITDEATSALDAESEAEVQEALDIVMKGRTSIIIAHRLGTIRAADFIYVMESGKIVESGTHHELMNLGGVYYTLVLHQNEEK